MQIHYYFLKILLIVLYFEGNIKKILLVYFSVVYFKKYCKETYAFTLIIVTFETLFIIFFLFNNFIQVVTIT